MESVGFGVPVFQFPRGDLVCRIEGVFSGKDARAVFDNCGGPTRRIQGDLFREESAKLLIPADRDCEQQPLVAGVDFVELLDDGLQEVEAR